MSNLTVNAINNVDVQNLQKQAASAWVNFNGKGTVSIRDQLNVTSITDNGTGNYTVNFTNTLPTADYCLNLSANRDDGASTLAATNYYNPTISNARMVTANAANASFLDAFAVSVVVFSS